MASVGYATLQVIPSMRGFKSAVQGELNNVGLNQLGKSVGAQAGQETSRSFAGTLGSGLRGAFGAIGETLASGFRVATTAAVGLGGAFAGVALTKGLDRLTTIQDATASLTITLGSAAKAGAFMNEILGVVKGTPFNLDQFATAGKNLVAFNIDAAKVPGILTAIGEAAAASGKGAGGVDRIVDAFGKISAQGKVSLDALYTISDAGVNALAILGNGFGVTTDEMRDMISRGAVPAGEAIDILTKGIVEGSTGIAGTTVALGGSMAKLRLTLSGAFGGAQAAVARFGAAFLEPFVGPITQGLQSVTSLLDGFAPKVKAFAESIAGSDGFARFTAFITDLPSKFGPVLGFIQNLGPALGPIAGLFASIASTNLSGLLGPLGGLVPPLGPIAGIIGGLVVASPELRSAFGGILSALGPLVSALGSGLAPILTSLVTLVGKVAGALIGPLGGVIRRLTPIFASIADTIGGSFAVAIDSLGPALEQTATVLGGAFGQALEALAPILPPLAVAFADIATAVAGALTDALTELAPVLPELAEAFGEVAVAVGKDLAASLVALAPAIPALASLVTVGADLIAKVPPEVLAKIVEAYLLFKGVNAVTGKVQEFSGAIRALKDTPIGDLAGSLASKLGDLLKIGEQKVALKLNASVAASVTDVVVEDGAEGLGKKLLPAVATKLGITLTPAGIATFAIPVAAALSIVAVTFTFRRDIEDAFEDFVPDEIKQGVVMNIVSIGLTTGPGVFLGFAGLLLSHVKEAIDDAGGVFEFGGDIVDGILGGIGDAFESAGETLQTIFYDGIAGAFKSALGISSPSTVMAALGAEIPAGLLLGIVQGGANLAGWFLALPGQIASWTAGIAVSLFQKGIEVMGGLFTGLLTGVTTVAGWLGSLGAQVAAWVGDAASWLVQKGIDVLSGLVRGFDSGVRLVIGWFSGLQGTITGAISGAGTWLLDAGRRIVGGILEGMKSGIGAVKDWLGGLADKFLAWKPIATDHLILRPAGLAIMKGLNDGMLEGLINVEKTLRDTTSLVASTPIALSTPALAKIDLSTAIPASAVAATSGGDTYDLSGSQFVGLSGEQMARDLQEQIAFERVARG